MNNSPFVVLSNINCNGHTEKKNGLTYLSWAWAWAEFKKLYPASFYTIYENAGGMFYHTDGKTCWVKTGVTLVDKGESTALEHIEYLPVMDYKNKSIPVKDVTSFDVNKAIQRSLTKAVARHGLGLYIYAGEDLPESAESKSESQEPQRTNVSETNINAPLCVDCGCVIAPSKTRTVQQIAHASKAKFGRVLCGSCANEEIARQENQTA